MTPTVSPTARGQAPAAVDHRHDAELDAETQGPPCGGAVSLISNTTQFSTLTSDNPAGLVRAQCTDDLTFPPANWSPLAVATDTPSNADLR